MKKSVLTAAVAAAVLSGCGVSGSGVSVGLGLGGSIGRHVGIGTGISVPLTFDRDKTAQQPSDSAMQQMQILTYFDTAGNAVDGAVKGGFYRRLISKQSDGFWVQDFYSGGEKRTDPMLLERSSVFEFRAHPQNGSYTVYAVNGSIMQQLNYKNGTAVK